MKKIEAIIRTEKLPEVKEALKSLEIGGMTVYAVSGWSRGKEESLQWKGQPVPRDLIAKSKLEVIVPDRSVKVVMDAIASSAKTGTHGDGIIFVLPVERALNIMSLCEGDQAVT
jgi:nitrogen regulatory protein P-II 1